MPIRPKDLSKLGYTNNEARSLALNIVKKHCKHDSKQYVEAKLREVLANPESFRQNDIWSALAEKISPTMEASHFQFYDLLDSPISYKVYGGQFIDGEAKRQMEVAMRLPVTVAGAMMPDAHVGYGLPIGGVLAADNAVIPYAVGVDIGCRMSLSIYEVEKGFIKRYATQLKRVLEEQTHFGMKGGLGFMNEHELMENPRLQETELLRSLHGRAREQLGTSGGGNHFVEFGEIELIENNVLGVAAGKYFALLSHSGSRGLGAQIARYYVDRARELCRLPREAQHLAWLGLDSELGQEYWLSMNLAGDYARANHECIHENISKALKIKALANVSNHHNFAWIEEIGEGKTAIVHRKGATPATKGVAGFIPGSMATPGYLVSGKGEPLSLNSASHGAGRQLSRSMAKTTITGSALRQMLKRAGVELIGGCVEESPDAYKDIDLIMPAQKDLVDIHGKFMPRIVRMADLD